MDIEKYSELWDNARNGAWVLEKLPSGGHIIINKEDMTIFGIEDDAVYEAVIDRMIQEGVSVVDEVPYPDNMIPLFPHEVDRSTLSPEMQTRFDDFLRERNKNSDDDKGASE